ncbi:MAG: hypothetical protein ACSLE6_04800 [Mycobacterium sp.]
MSVGLMFGVAAAIFGIVLTLVLPILIAVVIWRISRSPRRGPAGPGGLTRTGLHYGAPAAGLWSAGSTDWSSGNSGSDHHNNHNSGCSGSNGWGGGSSCGGSSCGGGGCGGGGGGGD